MFSYQDDQWIFDSDKDFNVASPSMITLGSSSIGAVLELNYDITANNTTFPGDLNLDPSNKQITNQNKI